MDKNVLILGIGNVLWADEGFGVRAVDELNRHYQFTPNVTLLDGGTQGIYLVQHVEQADILVIFDAIDYGLAPGTIKVIEDDDVPSFLGAKKMSLHQTGFQEVLAMAEMLGNYPDRLLLVGVQPTQLEDFGGSLQDATKAQINPAIEIALTWLCQFDVNAKKRAEPLPQTHSLSGKEITLDRYESERPSASDACRHGDERVLYDDNYNISYKPHPLKQDAKISCDVDHRGKY